MVGSLYNTGSHSVTVRFVEAKPMVSTVRWSVYRTAPEGSVFGVNTPWRSFPATIPAQGTIRLLLTLHKPTTCASDPEQHGAGTFDGSLLVHWRSLLQTHATVANVFALPITVC